MSNDKNLMISSNPKKLITTIGIENFSIIDTNDALLVAPLDRSQNVKDIVKLIQTKNNLRPYLMCDTNIGHRPWGYYEIVHGDDNSGYKVKKITIFPHKRLSLQSHSLRSEHWVIVSGMVRVQIDDNLYEGTKDSRFYIPVNSLHRIENIGDTNATFIETQIGSYLGEDDIKRYEDDFGRIKN